MARPHLTLTQRYFDAVAYAAEAHAWQARKGGNIAYMSHLLGVSSLVIEAGGDEDQAIAGLLHDVVEDQGGLQRLADVRRRYGDRVAGIVLGCSDSLDGDDGYWMDYWERKQAYLDRLETEPPELVMVSIADKVHNARALVTDLEYSGVAVFNKFHGSAREIIHYYRECLRIGRAADVSHVLTSPLEVAIRDVELMVYG
ncbi:MAG: HD domain-containing protein [Candidatus Nanopelagicales bacterium]|nr:HD domain-containing protein [Candidatus Nanopelagicales bacterium]